VAVLAILYEVVCGLESSIRAGATHHKCICAGTSGLDAQIVAPGVAQVCLPEARGEPRSIAWLQIGAKRPWRNATHLVDFIPQSCLVTCGVFGVFVLRNGTAKFSRSVVGRQKLFGGSEQGTRRKVAPAVVRRFSG